MDKKKAKKSAMKAADVTAATAGGVTHTVVKVLATILVICITTGLLFTCIFAYYVKKPTLLRISAYPWRT